MNAFQRATDLAVQGRSADALSALSSGSFDNEDPVDVRILRGDLRHRLGDLENPKTDIQTLLRSHKLSPRQRAMCYLILGRVAAETGESNLAVELLQKSAHCAAHNREFSVAAWAQARLLTVTADSMGAESIRPLLGELRVNALRSGDPHVLAVMHIYLGQTEAQRNALGPARRHLALATDLLNPCPNAWLEAMAEHLRAAIDIMSSDLVQALVHGARAVDLAERCGQSLQRAATYANYGYTLYLTGDFERAIHYYSRALELLPKRGDHFSGAIDTLARIHLEQGSLEACEGILNEIEAVVESDEIRARYVYRHSLLTRVRLQIAKEELGPARETIDLALRAGLHTGDKALVYSALTLKAELCVQAGDIGTASAVVDELGRQMATQPPDRIAEYNAVLASLLMATGHPGRAKWHRDRARRFYRSIEHRQGEGQLNRAWAKVVGKNLGEPRSFGASGDAALDRDPGNSSSSVHCLANLLTVIDRPDLLAAELLQLLNESGAVEGAAAERIRGGQSRRIAEFGHISSAIPHSVITVNAATSAEFRLLVNPKDDVRSGSTLNALIAVSQILDEFASLRRENERRRALWPPEVMPFEGEQSVVAGEMREVLSVAQRVAPTKVTVLVIGESGTGKEIVARAVHDFSDRANKPFVPLNCAAVPQHLLESTLFGHRRGAFTGADRDSPGLIRSARDGTLFLDEIGELALDLQPKLLRFLESGEIAPLGDPNSSIVNVRIVAATNRNLADLVQQGRFREDLFYRLNVVRLTLRPLRERRDEIPGLVNHFVGRFAKEFGKGYIPVAEETMERLLLYRWPGNIRQLQNEVRRMVALVEPGATLEPEMIAEEILAALPLVRTPKRTQEVAVPLHEKLPSALAKIETEMIKAALRDHHGKVDDAAKALGISRKGLYLKRQRLGI